MTERTSRKTRLEGTVVTRGEVCARAEVVAILLYTTLEQEVEQDVS
jgi:hypothetical protein